MSAPIYSNPRAWRVRIAQAAVWGFGAIIVWLAYFSGGPFGGEIERAFVWAIGALVLAVMAATPLYLRAYVTEIEAGAQGVRITTLDVLGQRRFVVDASALSLGGVRHDHVQLRQVVNNIWLALRVKGRRAPLILDLTPPAELNARALERVLNP